jgi:hypothetical protein
MTELSLPQIAPRRDGQKFCVKLYRKIARGQRRRAA